MRSCQEPVLFQLFPSVLSLTACKQVVSHYYLPDFQLLLELQAILSPFWAFTASTDPDMFSLLCELLMTRNILLTAQGVAFAVNCGARLLHVVISLAMDTPRSPGRTKKPDNQNQTKPTKQHKPKRNHKNPQPKPHQTTTKNKTNPTTNQTNQNPPNKTKPTEPGE